jgi:hypothetical protein
MCPPGSFLAIVFLCPGRWRHFLLLFLLYSNYSILNNLCLLADCCMTYCDRSLKGLKKHPEWVGGGVVLVGMFAFEIAMFFIRINMFPQKGHIRICKSQANNGNSKMERQRKISVPVSMDSAF